MTQLSEFSYLIAEDILSSQRTFEQITSIRTECYEKIISGSFPPEVQRAILCLLLDRPRRTALLLHGAAALPQPGEELDEYLARLGAMVPAPSNFSVRMHPGRSLGQSFGYYSKYSGLGPPPPQTNSFAANPFPPLSRSPLIPFWAGG